MPTHRTSPFRVASTRKRPRGDSFGYRQPRAADSFAPKKGASNTKITMSAGPTWGLARPRDLFGQLSATQANRPWKLGMALAFNRSLLNEGAVRWVQLLCHEPFQGDPFLNLMDAVMIAFPSKQSPDGRWTVTVNPRTGPMGTRPLELGRQREVYLSIDGVRHRFVRVQLQPELGDGGTWSARGIIGELVEDSLLIAPDGTKTWKPDAEADLRMVLAVAPEDGSILIDGEQRWRRVPIASGRFRLQKEVIDARESALLDTNAWMAQTTSYACNCPAYAGFEMIDWRNTGGGTNHPGMAAVGTNRWSQLDSAQGVFYAGYGDDPVDAFVRQFGSPNWDRPIITACKHIHAARWMVGCPTAEPNDAYAPDHESWRDHTKTAQQDEIAWPLQDPDYMEKLNRTMMLDQRYRDLNIMPLAFSTADAIGTLPVNVRLYEIDGTIQPLKQRAFFEGMSTQRVIAADEGLARAITGAPLPPPEVISRQQGRRHEPFDALQERAVITRFNRCWPVPDPERNEQAVVGDVWVGAGTTQVAYPYEAPFSRLSDTPFINPWRPFQVLP
jgi:hypothetical protein